MSKKPTIVIAFPRGGIIPASVLNAKDNYTASPHKPVEVPKAYGEHLISDCLAYDYLEADKRKKADAEAAEKSAETARGDAAAMEVLRAEVARLTSERDQLAADKVRLSGEIGSLQADLNDANKALSDERANVVTLTEQLSEVTKPQVQQASLEMDAESGKSK